MGYYTQYDITNNSEGIKEAILNQSQYSDFNSEVKWYDWQKDIILVSTLFPNTEIRVEGVGEENEDVWRAFAKDGELFISRAELSFGPYKKV